VGLSFKKIVGAKMNVRNKLERRVGTTLGILKDQSIDYNSILIDKQILCRVGLLLDYEDFKSLFQRYLYLATYVHDEDSIGLRSITVISFHVLQNNTSVSDDAILNKGDFRYALDVFLTNIEKKKIILDVNVHVIENLANIIYLAQICDGSVLQDLTDRLCPLLQSDERFMIDDLVKLSRSKSYESLQKYAFDAAYNTLSTREE
jgi:hypothetical protein